MATIERCACITDFGSDKKEDEENDEADEDEEDVFSSPQFDDEKDALDRQLRAVGLALHTVLGDGNCAYRALCVAMGMPDDLHEQMRHRVTTFMIDNAESSPMVVLAGYRVERVRNHARRLAMPNVWADDSVIRAAAVCLGRSIRLHMVMPNSPELYPSGLAVDDLPALKLAYTTNHYDAVYNQEYNLV